MGSDRRHFGDVRPSLTFSWNSSAFSQTARRKIKTSFVRRAVGMRVDVAGRRGTPAARFLNFPPASSMMSCEVQHRKSARLFLGAGKCAHRLATNRLATNRLATQMLTGSRFLLGFLHLDSIGRFIGVVNPFFAGILAPLVTLTKLDFPPYWSRNDTITKQ